MSELAAKVFIGTGRRKTASARVRIQEGTGKVTVNGREFETYFPTELLQATSVRPSVIAELRDQIDMTVLVQGGGLSGQSEAVALGLARALQTRDPELRSSLKQAGLLRRDPRMRERKKAGQPGARKRFQFSKR
ncbi:MAG: 30S ribosomal protein S9 [Opitutales bacterium]|nr:30S ribosomal protein S9 [Opitutales bacterium]